MTNLEDAIERHIGEQMKKPIVKHDWQVKNCISYWYPVVAKLPGVKTPKTTVLAPNVELYQLIDVLEAGPRSDTVAAFNGLVEDITKLGEDTYGFPLFLRSGGTSGKHSWEDACFVASADRVARNLGTLIEDAAMKDQALDVFAVREMLPTEPAFHAFWGNMPIVRELRVFVRDDQVLGSVPYWPAEAFEDQKVSDPDWREKLAELNHIPLEEVDELRRLSTLAGKALGGEWSVDWLWTKWGWYLTDCALGRMSWGWSKAWST